MPDNLNFLIGKKGKKNIIMVFGALLFFFSLWQLYVSWHIGQILQSHRITSGKVVTAPFCYDSPRMISQCHLAIAEFGKRVYVEIPAGLCDTLKVGDVLELRYSMDKKHFFVFNDRFARSVNSEIKLFGFLLMGSVFICFFGFRNSNVN